MMVDDDGIPLTAARLAANLHEFFALLGVIKKEEVHVECPSPSLVGVVFEVDCLGKVHGKLTNGG